MAPDTAVVFDIDDTLIDFSGASRAALTTWLDRLGVCGARAESACRIWREIEVPHYTAYTRGLISFTEQRRRRVRDFCAALSLPVPEDAGRADAWFAGYVACLDDTLRLFPDVVPVLDALDGLGVAVAALSNSSAAHQDRKLRRLGIRHRMRALVCCDDAGGVGKPRPQIFHTVCAALGMAPDRVWYVGDDLHLDARAATAAGLRGVWLNRSGQLADPGPVTVLRCLRELPGLVDRARRLSRCEEER